MALFCDSTGAMNLFDREVCCQPELPESWRQRRTFAVVPADTKATNRLIRSEQNWMTKYFWAAAKHVPF